LCKFFLNDGAAPQRQKMDEKSNYTDSFFEEIWHNLRLAFQQDSLVLVLGPGLSTTHHNGQTVPLAQVLAQHIARRLAPPNSPLAEADLATLAGMLVEQKGRSTLDVAMD